MMPVRTKEIVMMGKQSTGLRGKRLPCVIRNLAIGAVARGLSLLPFVRKLFVSTIFAAEVTKYCMLWTSAIN
jgi:hypothetical protein